MSDNTNAWALLRTMADMQMNGENGYVQAADDAIDTLQRLIADARNAIKWPTLDEPAVKAMDDNELYAAMGLLQDEIAERSESSFPEALHEYLTEDTDAELREEINAAGGPTQMVFRTDTWDDGRFYAENLNTLTLANGTTIDDIPLSDTPIDDAVRDLSGVRRREGTIDAHSTLVVDFATNAIRHE